MQLVQCGLFKNPSISFVQGLWNVVGSSITQEISFGCSVNIFSNDSGEEKTGKKPGDKSIYKNNENIGKKLRTVRRSSTGSRMGRSASGWILLN